jgi:hypothetical protein
MNQLSLFKTFIEDNQAGFVPANSAACCHIQGQSFKLAVSERLHDHRIEQGDKASTQRVGADMRHFQPGQNGADGQQAEGTRARRR